MMSLSLWPMLMIVIAQLGIEFPAADLALVVNNSSNSVMSLLNKERWPLRLSHTDWFHQQRRPHC